jgi:hypothetical protein
MCPHLKRRFGLMMSVQDHDRWREKSDAWIRQPSDAPRRLTQYRAGSQDMPRWVKAVAFIATVAIILMLAHIVGLI